MNFATLFWLAPISSILALGTAFYFYKSVNTTIKDDDSKSKEMSELVDLNSIKALKYNYKATAILFLVMFALFALMSYAFRLQSPWIGIAFLTGGLFSALSGYFSLKSANKATNLIIEKAGSSLKDAFEIAFKSACISILVAIGFGLLDISIWWKIMNMVLEAKNGFFKDSLFALQNNADLLSVMLSFTIGAICQTLISRISGGIYAKSADLGADLAIKSEAGIPENSLTNPAVIAKSIGDVLNNIVGTNADFYDSFCIAILSAAIIGANAFNEPVNVSNDLQLGAILIPFVLAASSILATIIGIFFIKINEDSTAKDIILKINIGSRISSFITAIASIFIIKFLLPGNISLLGSVVTGIMAGIVINWATEYYTSQEYDPAKEAANQSSTGASSVIIEGLTEGLQSTCIPIATTAIAIILAYGFADGFNNSDFGLYGISIACLSMISTLSINIAATAYSSIINNVAYNIQISEITKDTKTRTDTMATFNATTISIGRSILTASTVFITLSLLSSYASSIKNALEYIFKYSGEQFDKYIYIAIDKAIPYKYATSNELLQYYAIQPTNPLLISGICLGVLLAFVLCAFSLRAINSTSHILAEEIRRQFKEIPGLLQGEIGSRPDYTLCTSTISHYSLKELIFPISLVICLVFCSSAILGVAGILGIILGISLSGFALTLMLTNAGGIWNSAKLYIESGQFGGKDSESHKATVISDVIGNVLKDSCISIFTSFVKFITILSIVIIGLTINWSPTIQKHLGLSHSDRAYKEAYIGMVNSEILSYPPEERKKPVLNEEEENYNFENDPLMGTEDIILPVNDPNKNSVIEPEKYKYEPGTVKPLLPADNESIDESKNKSTKPNEKTKESSSSSSGFDEGFGDGGFNGFDEPAKPANDAKKEDKKQNTSESFDEGFGGGFDGFDEPAKPANDAKKEDKKQNTSESFDEGFGGGFDSFDEPAKPANDAKKEDKKQNTSESFDEGFGGGFDSFDEPAKPANEAKKEEVKQNTNKEKEPQKVEQIINKETKNIEEQKEEKKESKENKEDKNINKTEVDDLSGGFDSFDEPAKPANGAKKEEVKQNKTEEKEPQKVEQIINKETKNIEEQREENKEDKNIENTSKTKEQIKNKTNTSDVSEKSDYEITPNCDNDIGYDLWDM